MKTVIKMQFQKERFEFILSRHWAVVLISDNVRAATEKVVRSN